MPHPVASLDHAQAELTDIVFVELPKVGRVVKAGERCAVVESVKAASDIYAPVAGEIVEINETLQNDPGLVNRNPYLERLDVQAEDRQRSGSRCAVDA